MTCEEFDELRLRAGERCEICGVGERFTPQGVLAIDHDSPVGWYAVRGLLCNRCNSAFDKPSIAGPERDGYLTNQWYLTSTIRAANGITKEDTSRLAMGALAALDIEVAQYRKVGGSSRPVIDKALTALRAGAEPGDVYARVPFTSTYMRTKARDAGVPAGRPGIKPPRGSQAAHDESSSPTNRA